jgi:hypothetical protein
MVYAISCGASANRHEQRPQTSRKLKRSLPFPGHFFNALMIALDHICHRCACDVSCAHGV